MGEPRVLLEDAIESILKSYPPIDGRLTDAEINGLVIELAWAVRNRTQHVDNAIVELREYMEKVL
jgi:hypothetical protein